MVLTEDCSAHRIWDEVEGFDKADYSLHAVNLASWERVHLREFSGLPPTPLEKVFASLVAKFSHWNLPKLRFCETD